MKYSNTIGGISYDLLPEFISGFPKGTKYTKYICLRKCKASFVAWFVI